jgi:hypothetical protein
MTMMKKMRNRQRGAAMAEMVLLAPVMILMWVGIDYFRSGYARRLEAISESHRKAWAAAYSNDGSCFANKEPWAGFTGENDAMNSANTGEKGAEAATAFSGNTSSSMFMYAHTNINSTWSTRGARWEGGAKGSVKGGTYIACNEVVPNGSSDQNVLTPLWDFVRNLF